MRATQADLDRLAAAGATIGPATVLPRLASCGTIGPPVKLPPGIVPVGKVVETFTIHLPLPPSVNHYWRHVGHKVLISREGRNYRQDVQYAVMTKCGVMEPMRGRLRVVVEVFPPDKRRRDLDNLAKSLLDALAHAGVYADDSQIDDLRIVRVGECAWEHGEVVVKVATICPGPQTGPGV